MLGRIIKWIIIVTAILLLWTYFLSKIAPA
jgi:hypothetical protein